MTKTLSYIYAVLFLSLAPIGAAAQELDCNVTINADQIEGTNKQVFQTLQQAVSEYMNTTVFTNAQFAANEKIECRMFFTISEYSDDIFKGDLQVQSLRPVYNSSYTSTLINFRDAKLEFTYRENEPLVFSVNNMESQITAILNFYAYLILAVDFDSFSPRGGDPYFDRLAQIVQMAQSSGETGWKAFEDNKNRSAVLSSFTDPATTGIRDMMYKYHRQGLDNMSVSVDKGRAAVTESLSEIEKVSKTSPMSVALSMFKDAKLDELVNIYSKAPQEERERVYKLLEPIYPTEQSRLEEIKKGAENR
ncbi:MAG: DUF4835 family protein [Muribaculaceae bacterium]|nr:DUF4835 family protein [Muribaculaceae bacterium]